MDKTESLKAKSKWDTASRSDAERELRGPNNGRAGGILVILLLALLGFSAGFSVFIVVLSLLVILFLHELGHYLVAKKAGMKVTEFFIGFGPKLWSFRRGETEYGIKAIPAGAYVRVRNE